MPWVFETIAPGATLGIEGKVWWRRPNFLQDSEPFVEIPMPDDLGGVDEIPTHALYEGARYFAGGFTQNALITRDLNCWSQGIDAPLEIPSVTVSGTGVTAEIIAYWRYFDEKTGERSPLSGGKSLTLANQAILWQDFPTSKNPRVSHIELWVSFDGSLPRFLTRRQVGVTGTILTAPQAGDLGEADTEDFSRFPRCRVNAIYHDRQFMAGDELNRDTLYISLIGLPERMSTLTLKTRNGEPIVGLKVVNDRLLVFCPFSQYTVDGFTEDDLAMQIGKPDIGLIGPNAMAEVGGMLQYWSHNGPNVTDGSGHFFLGDEIQETYVEEYRAKTGFGEGNNSQEIPDTRKVNDYESAWCVNNIKEYCTRLYIEHGLALTNSLPTFWAAHYQPSGPNASGSFTAPMFSFDTSAVSYTCGGVLTLPGSRQSEVYTAARDNTGLYGTGAFLLRENVRKSFRSDGSGFARTDHDEVGMILKLGAFFMGEEGGDVAHGKRFTDLDIFMRSDRRPGDPEASNLPNGFILQVWTGDTYAALDRADLVYQVNGFTDTINFTPSYRKVRVTQPLIDTADFPTQNQPRTVTAIQPRTTWHHKPGRAVGVAISIELQCFDPEATFYGWQAGFKTGPTRRQRKTAVFEES